MSKPASAQIVNYWHRSYRTVDGLWFMKVEELYGFDTALEIDHEVWKIMPKIQARMVKNMLGVEKGIDDLFEAIKLKLELEGYKFQTERDDNNSFRIIIIACPWHNIMLRSNREHLSGRVGTLICNEEYNVWISEFGGNMSFELEDQICEGSSSCVMKFYANNKESN